MQSTSDRTREAYRGKQTAQEGVPRPPHAGPLADCCTLSSCGDIELACPVDFNSPPRKRGRPPISNKLTATERQRRWREKRRDISLG